MADLIDLGILSLASGRIAYSIAKEDVFQPLRLFVLRKDSRREEDFSLTSLINCYWCLSFWSSLVLVVTYLVFGDAIVTLATPFAVWYLATWLGKELDR